MPYFSSANEVSSGFYRPGYKFILTDPFGRFIQILPILSCSYAGAVNQVGNMTLNLPGSINRNILQDNYRIEVWRSIENVNRLDMETVWIIKAVNLVFDERGQKLWEVMAQTLNVIIQSRIVAYVQGSSQASKTDNSDDMMKAIMRENLGSSATTGRNISAYLSVQADVGLGVSISKAFEYRPLMDIFTEIVESSLNTATPVFFDIVMNNQTAEFRTYINQRGFDRRAGQPGAVTLSPGRMNVGTYKVTQDFTEEATFVYCFGPGQLGARIITTASNSARIARSPFGRIERKIDGSNEANSTQLQEEANAALQFYRPRTIVEGSIRQTNQTIYGKHWGMGDQLTFKPQSDWAIDVRVDAVQVDISEQAENIQAYFRG